MVHLQSQPTPFWKKERKWENMKINDDVFYHTYHILYHLSHKNINQSTNNLKNYNLSSLTIYQSLINFIKTSCSSWSKKWLGEKYFRFCVCDDWLLLFFISSSTISFSFWSYRKIDCEKFWEIMDASFRKLIKWFISSKNKDERKWDFIIFYLIYYHLIYHLPSMISLSSHPPSTIISLTITITSTIYHHLISISQNPVHHEMAREYLTSHLQLIKRNLSKYLI